MEILQKIFSSDLVAGILSAAFLLSFIGLAIHIFYGGLVMLVILILLAISSYYNPTFGKRLQS